MPDVSWAPEGGATALAHLGVIRARGPQAAEFLHGQLTQDTLHLASGQATFAAYLSPKGRVLASAVVLRRAQDELLLVCHHSVLAATLRRLKMFVLHAQVTLDDATADIRLVGLLGRAAQALLPADAPPLACRATAGVHTIALHPADGQPRALWIAPTEAPGPGATPLAQADWLLAEVRSAVAVVSEGIADGYVPQMLNYESLGALNFRKGCYPGQEVVARSQYRGTVKRRTFLARAPAPMSIGADVFNGHDAVGSVVQSAAMPEGGASALVVLPIALAGQALRVDTPEGAALTLEPLPYELAAPA